MKEDKEKRNVYVKIMYKEPLLVPHTLENTVATLNDWLDVGILGNLMWVDFCGFFKIFPKHKEMNDIYGICC